MLNHTNYRIVSLALLAIVFALSGCGKSSHESPPKQQVQNAVAAVIPPFVSLDSIELEPIAIGSESVKVNFKSIVISKEDLYQVDRMVDGTPRVTLIKKVQSQGTKFSLYGFVLAHRIMDNWTIETPLMQTGADQFGSPKGAFGSQAYVSGGNEAIAALKQQETNAENQLLEKKAALERQNREKLAQVEQEQALKLAREEQEKALRDQQAKNRLVQETAQKEAAAKRKIEEQKQDALNRVESLEKNALESARKYEDQVAQFGSLSRFENVAKITRDYKQEAETAKQVAEQARKEYKATWGSSNQ